MKASNMFHIISTVKREQMCTHSTQYRGSTLLPMCDVRATRGQVYRALCWASRIGVRPVAQVPDLLLSIAAAPHYMLHYACAQVKNEEVYKKSAVHCT